LNQWCIFDASFHMRIVPEHCYRLERDLLPEAIMLIIYSELEVNYNSGFYRRTGCLSMKTILKAACEIH
jgi:hypothetical protein